MGDLSIAGRFFYSNDLSSVNFERRSENISTTLAILLTHFDDQDPPAIFIQSASIPECLPKFSDVNALFDHYVFQRDPVAHLPPERRGALGEMTPQLAAHIRAALLKRLSRS